MEIEIIEKKDNPLLGRTEIRFRAAFSGATPTRADIKRKLAAVLNSQKELTVLDKFENDFGSQRGKGYAKIYKDEKSMKIEPKYIIERNIKADEKPKKESQKQASEDSADAKPDSADAKPESADAKPDSADAKPESADAKPESADAKPESADAKPEPEKNEEKKSDGKESPKEAG